MQQYIIFKAKDEGITNHEILNEWIDLREKYYTYQDGANEIKRMILLSSLFERMSNNVSSKEIEIMILKHFKGLNSMIIMSMNL